MREVRVRSSVTKGKLQDRHARNVLPISKRNHIRSDHAQVLGEERQPAQFFAQFVKELVTRPIHPTSFNRCRLAGGNFPELRKTAEVIETDEIAGLRCPAQALYPPLVPGSTDRVPVVQRVSPSLPGSAEIVWRNA